MRPSRAALLLAPLAVAAMQAGCSAAADEDAAASGAASELSTNPPFSFQPRAEGRSGNATDASLTNAYWLAYASFETYANGGQAEAKASLEQVPGLDPVAFQWFEDPLTDCTAMYFRTPEVAVLAFKGTIFQDWRQYLILADVGLEPIAGGQANAGFVDGFDRLWPDIRAELVADALPSGVPLYVAGHSLGGAFATVTAAAMLHDPAFTPSGETSALAGVYTYGAPRVGDQAFSDDLSVQRDARGIGLFRFVDDKDPVPSVLPAWPWAHPGHRLASIFAPTSDSFIVHEEEDLIWLDVNAAVYYGGDAQVRFDARWENLDPIVSDHTAYVVALAPHA
jgi:hypothetical protein